MAAAVSARRQAMLGWRSKRRTKRPGLMLECFFAPHFSISSRTLPSACASALGKAAAAAARTRRRKTVPAAASSP
eukprot:343556-Rhodomonas_salina.1